MTTPIGEGLLRSRARLVLAGLIGLAVVGTDLILIRAWPDYPWSATRTMLPLAALAFFLILLRGERVSVGLTLVPLPGYRYWLKAVLVLGGIIGVLVAAGASLWWLTGFPLPIYRVAPADIGPSLLRMCLYAPLVEEGIYRLALCVPLVGARPAGGDDPRRRLAVRVSARGLWQPGTGQPHCGLFPGLGVSAERFAARVCRPAFAGKFMRLELPGRRLVLVAVVSSSYTARLSVGSRAQIQEVLMKSPESGLRSNGQTFTLPLLMKSNRDLLLDLLLLLPGGPS